MDARAVRGIMLGYGDLSYSYLVWVPHISQVRLMRSVTRLPLSLRWSASKLEDIAVTKKRCRGRMALMGNVQCNLLQDGPLDAIRESALYCLKNASHGGGYIFSTSNTIFPGMPLAHYEYMLDVFREFVARALGSLAKLRRREEENVLVICHGILMQAIEFYQKSSEDPADPDSMRRFHQYMPKNPVPNLGAWNFPNPAVNRDQAGHGQGKGAIGNSTRPARSPQPARKIIRIERGDGNS